MISYLILGAFAGVLAGLLGVGGGLVIVPVLLLLFAQAGISSTVSMHLAIGTSLATIVFTSLSSIWAHQQKSAILWPVVWQLSSGIVVGAWCGAVIAKQMSYDGLRIGFGLFELWVAIQMGFVLKPKAQRQLPNKLVLTTVGGGIGAVSAMVGIGGGTMTVPFLVWCNIAMRQAIATSAACGLPIALAGVIGFIWTGWGQADLPKYTVGYVNLPALLGISVMSMLCAPLGAHLAHRLDPNFLKRVFALFLLALAIKMLLAG